MRRYKELKYEGNVYTEQYKIDEILIDNEFSWFLDCEVENVRLEIQFKTLIFNSGVFFNGTWIYGVFRDGEWKNGFWDNGVWYNGIWRRGTFNSGLIFNGKFFNGEIKEKTTIRGGNFYDIKIDKNVEREDKYEIDKEDIDNDELPEPVKINEKSNKLEYLKEFDVFKDDVSELVEPPENIINLAIGNDSKFLAYTDENGWFICDYLLENGLLDSYDFRKIKQFSIIENVKKRKFLRNSYRYDIKNLKPFDFITNYNHLFN